MNVNVHRPARPTRPTGAVRVIAGTLKRSKLAVPDRPGLRPTPDRVRETLFNWLEPHVHSARVLDVCAGTGVLGIEALSRGAAFAHLNEPNGELADLLLSNANRLNIADRVHVTRLPAQRLLATDPDQRFDIAFVDPPYDAALWQQILELLPRWLAPSALVYVEHPQSSVAPITAEWRALKQAKAGTVVYYLLEHAPGSASLSDQNSAESAA